jgi:hypothetical protein
MNPTFGDVVSLIAALAWPMAVIFLTLAFRREVKAFFRALGERATKLSWMGAQLELAANQVTTDRLVQPSSSDEKATALHEVEIARAVAGKFDYWMRNYNHPSAQSHREALLDWLVHDRGAQYVGRNYGVFKALAEILSKMGYDTAPPPSEGEFMAKLFEAGSSDNSPRLG